MCPGRADEMRRDTVERFRAGGPHTLLPVELGPSFGEKSIKS